MLGERVRVYARGVHHHRSRLAITQVSTNFFKGPGSKRRNNVSVGVRFRSVLEFLVDQAENQTSSWANIVAVESIITSAYEAADCGGSGWGQVLNKSRAILAKKSLKIISPTK